MLVQHGSKVDSASWQNYIKVDATLCQHHSIANHHHLDVAIFDNMVHVQSSR